MPLMNPSGTRLKLIRDNYGYYKIEKEQAVLINTVTASFALLLPLELLLLVLYYGDGALNPTSTGPLTIKGQPSLLEAAGRLLLPILARVLH